MKVRRIKGGRYQDKSNGLFIPKRLAKHILSMANSEPVKRHPNMRAVNIIKIKQYKRGQWSLDLGKLGPRCSELLYFGKVLTSLAMREVNDQSKELRNEFPDK